MTDARKRFLRRLLAVPGAVCVLAGFLWAPALRLFAQASETVTLRVANWEEYFDLGDWDEEELIELPSGDVLGENAMVDDFEDWYFETYGRRVKVEYSTFGTNEDLYNMLTLGDVYDLVCPSEYLIMKLMAEGALVPLSDAFFDESVEENYYMRGVSPFIRNLFETKQIGGEPWSRYAAGYMWGVTGLVYNPELVTREQASSWKILADPAFYRQVTIKDNVRDSYFAAVGAIKSDLLTSPEFKSAPDYALRLEEEMNDTSPEMIAQVEAWLKEVKENAFSFETDAGKADMITGKVALNYQWSGDGVYTMDQADEDDFTLAFAVPEESTDIYFDGWVMLKKGIDGDPGRQHAAEAFINFLSRPDNAVRNMYYTGYTSVLSGGEDPLIFEYAQYNYEAEEDEEEETVGYDLGYFFAGDEAGEQGAEAGSGSREESGPGKLGPEEEGNGAGSPEEEAAGAVGPEEGSTTGAGGPEGGPEPEEPADAEDGYVLEVPASQVERQVSAAYPPADVIARSSIMIYFDDRQNADINQMWVNVRCYDIRQAPVWGWLLVAALLGFGAWRLVRRRSA